LGAFRRGTTRLTEDNQCGDILGLMIAIAALYSSLNGGKKQRASALLDYVA
jgi:hypothetical protein